MRTVYFNRKSLFLLLVVIGISVLCIITILNSNNDNNNTLKSNDNNKILTNSENTPINIKDINVRKKLVKNNIDNKKAEFIKKMMKHAWDGYKKYAWGANELNSIHKMASSQEIFGGPKMPATIVDAADTLYIMDMMKEYKEAEEYLFKNFKASDAIRNLSVFEMTIRFIGGFLSLFALTGKETYKIFAKNVADILIVSFNSPTGLPYNVVTPKDNRTMNYGWVTNNAHILADVGTLHLEFDYLSNITGDSNYRNKVINVRNIIEKQKKVDNLYGLYLSKDDGHFVTREVSLGAMGDSFYEYLLKEWLISNKKDTIAYDMYKEASKNIRKKMIIKSKGNFTYLVELKNGKILNKMSHLSCFSVGMFALEAYHSTDENEKKEIMELAEELGNTCYHSYKLSKTGLGPEMFHFDSTKDATSSTGEVQYFLRPEVIEGIYYLYKLTGNDKYKEWNWEIAQNIEKWCRNDAGYHGLRNVYNPEAGYDPTQQSFFLAETLKYLYLTFVNDKIPLDKSKNINNRELVKKMFYHGKINNFSKKCLKC
ncbi:Mannosyl-oligosaccharide alpha-1,2-mannosidase [Strongyloides ratti]|uniref:alpha-1,2-Mannosidase n=1 Tax=Strongyloides ratti TaxID=34506 RepID=A0A090LI75_STRRB|nr:Mannosyl-oligosaccharide alpha-1,2-mannosidase [Strongyloides ratti]CEF69521.1 Mannosyl-oligosaccharide alpha-1,2-mannosidase [Strongyloides ratti]